MTDTYTTAHGNTVRAGDRVVLTQGFTPNTDSRMGHTGTLVRVRPANALSFRYQDVKVFSVEDESGRELSGYMVEPADFDGTPAIDPAVLQLDAEQVARMQALGIVREAFGPNLLAEDYVELAQFVVDGTKALEAVFGTAVHEATEAMPDTSEPLTPRRSLPDYLRTAPDSDGDMVGLTGYLHDLVVSVSRDGSIHPTGHTALLKGVDRDNVVRWFLEYAQAVGITLED